MNEKVSWESVENKIRQSNIIRSSSKDFVIEKIRSILDNKDRRSWFEIKMILFRNRYDRISKDKFFNWLGQTNLIDLCDM